MSVNTIPKFGKVELLIHNPTKNNEFGKTKISFDDCGLMITGDYIIIVIDEKNDINSTNTSTGKIYPLSQVLEYKTHAT